MDRSDIPSLDDLRAFEATARLGSVRLAADSLALTHGAVSRRITKLANDIGVRLFEKNGRGLRLTSAGETLNLPQLVALSDEGFLSAVDRALEAILDRPGSIIVVSLGFDTYGRDPIGDFALTTPVYHEVGRRVAATGRRLVILQEGGYYRPALGDNAVGWLRGAEGR